MPCLLERYRSIACTHFSLFLALEGVAKMSGNCMLGLPTSWLLIYEQWWGAAHRDWAGCVQRNNVRRFTCWGTCSSEEWVRCLTPCHCSTKLVSCVTFWVLSEMIVKIMTAVSSARKGESEQLVRMRKQIKPARELTTFKVLCICGGNAAISIKVKNMPTFWSRNSLFRICFPTDILVHVGKDVCI